MRHAERRHDCRAAGIETVVQQAFPPRIGLEVDRHEAQPLRRAVAQLGEALPLPCLGCGWSTSNTVSLGGDFGPALGERVDSGAEEHVLVDAVVRSLGDEVLDEPGPRDDRGADARVAYSFMSGRWRQSGSGATSCSPTWSSRTCGGASNSTCSARHSATRAAELSGCKCGVGHFGACSIHSRPSGSRTVISLVPQCVSSHGLTTSMEASRSTMSAAATPKTSVVASADPRGPRR